MIKGAFAVLCIFLLLLLSLSSQKSDGITSSNMEDSFMDNVRMVFIHADGTEWEADIEKVIIDSDKDSAEIFNTFFSFPQHNLTVSSDGGFYDVKSDDLLLKGSVIARKDDMAIITDSIKWYADERKFKSDSPMRIKGVSFEIDGDGFDISEKGDLVINENVKAKLFGRK